MKKLGIIFMIAFLLVGCDATQSQSTDVDVEVDVEQCCKEDYPMYCQQCWDEEWRGDLSIETCLEYMGCEV